MSNEVEGQTLIRNVHLAHADANLARQLWDVHCVNGRVHSVIPADDEAQSMQGIECDSVIEGEGGVLIPSLCHAHIHLDKCFILEQCDPLLTGSLPEALHVTNKAKAAFPQRQEDLYNRASRLIRESVEAGVTAMRAYVEIDIAVRMVCLETGLRLKAEWQGICDIQLVAFAQEPLYPSPEAESPGENFELLQKALTDPRYTPGISVVGSAPWVEPSRDHAHKNIAHILAFAQTYNLHADFHIDYNLDANTEPMVWETLRQMREAGWTKSSTAGHRRVTIGHATRLGMFSAEEWTRLRTEIDEIPLEIVGLPQSDIYMMGRASADGSRAVPLAGRTLDAARTWRQHGVRVALSVNNVENAFTPQGCLDPLMLACLGVGLFQVGTEPDWRELLRAVSTTSKEAIGMHVYQAGGHADEDGLMPRVGDRADFVLLHEARRWQSVILSPCFDRSTIVAGKVVAKRRAVRWNALAEKDRK